MPSVDNRYLNAEQIDAVGKTAIGKSFREIAEGVEINESSKGGLGNFIEENLFHYPANNDANPDFKEAGIELKVTPIKKVTIKKKETYSAKERLVLDVINYEEEYLKTFETSAFWHKNAHLYLMFYEYIKGVSKYDLKIRYTMLFNYPEEDLIIIKQDWEYIINKIKSGLAHELSEGDTMYLGACPKGADSSSVRRQPFSSIPAMQRAYCLKSSYMTSIVRNYVVPGMDENIASVEELHKKTFEEIIIDRFSPFKGISERVLLPKYNISENNKNKYELLAREILGIKGKLTEAPEFVKANITVKCIRMQYNGSVKESVSFPAFDFCEIVNQTWETSELREQFETQKYLFVVFKEMAFKSNEYAFEKVVLWNMPIKVLDTEVRKVWEKTVEVLKTGNILTGEYTTQGGRINNFPKISQNLVSHVRPHGSDMFSVSKLPVPDKVSGESVFTRQCFWLNAKYIAKVVRDSYGK